MSEFPLTSRRGFLRTAAVLLPADGLAGCEGGKQGFVTLAGWSRNMMR
ncbi:hypothetical protein AB3X96_39080 [Paraburkholderia sp. BR13439]